MFRIRRFGIVKTANVAAVMYVFIILIFVIPIGLIALAAGAVGSARDPGAAAAAGGILVLGAVAALVYGIFGWIFTAIFCLIYNLVAGWTGGIEVQVERVEPVAPQLPAAWGPGAPAQQPPGWGPGAPPTQPPPGSASSG